MARTKKQSVTTPKQTPPFLPPAQLWIGSGTPLLEKVFAYLCSVLCPEQDCGSCTTCTQIRTREHYAIRWFEPEKYYTLETIQDLFSTISYQLEPDERIFFVLQHAEFLSTACANSLLKSMEEPPPGYHFILLAQRPDLLLDTVRSRCIVAGRTDTSPIHTHKDLFQFFTDQKPKDPSAFLKTLDRSKINERESVELVDALLAHWATTYRTAVTADDKKARRAIRRTLSKIETAIKHPPMSGSSKIFWKDLFLQLAS